MAKTSVVKQLDAFERAVDVGADEPDEERIELIDTLAKELVEHADDAKVAAALTRVVAEHSNQDIQYSVGEAILEASAPAKALEVMAKWVDHPELSHWNWMLGAKALLVANPDGAFTKLQKPLADEAFSERVLKALTEHKEVPDPRFFAAAAQWLPKAPGKPSCQYFYATHPARPEVQAELVKAIEKSAAAKHEPEWGHLYALFRDIKVPGALPSFLKIVARAASKGGWELTQPLNRIEELGDASALPALQALQAKVKGNAKAAVAATIAALEKLAPKPAVSAQTADKPASTAAKKPAAKPAKTSAKPARSAKPAAKAGPDGELADRLIEAGLSEDRVASVLKHVRTRIALQAAKAAKHTLGETRFGGEPDLPRGTKWPHVTCTSKDLVLQPHEYRAGTLPKPDAKGRYQVPLAFIAQIDLADLAPHDTEGLLPAKGMIWYFVRPEIVIGEKRELQQLASAVIFAKGKAGLVRTSPPDAVPKWNRYRAAKAKVTHARPLPPSAVEPIQNLSLVQSERDAYQTVVSAEAGKAAHSALGWAQAAYYRGVPGANEQVLLAVTSDSVSGFEFGDVQSIFFCIPTKALAKADFTKAYCIMDE